MITRSAIERAIEGGWRTDLQDKTWYVETKTTDFILSYIENAQWQFERLRYNDIALDPTFWKAMGKSCGWKREDFTEHRDAKWKNAAHRFYDLILTGGDTETFWADLLK